MNRSNAITGSGPEPRPAAYGPRLTCPHCAVQREFIRVPASAQLDVARAWRAPLGWEAICGNCGEFFAQGEGLG